MIAKLRIWKGSNITSPPPLKEPIVTVEAFSPEISKAAPVAILRPELEEIDPGVLIRLKAPEEMFVLPV